VDEWRGVSASVEEERQYAIVIAPQLRRHGFSHHAMKPYPILTREDMDIVVCCQRPFCSLVHKQYRYRAYSCGAVSDQACKVRRDADTGEFVALCVSTILTRVSRRPPQMGRGEVSGLQPARHTRKRLLRATSCNRKRVWFCSPCKATCTVGSNRTRNCDKEIYPLNCCETPIMVWRCLTNACRDMKPPYYRLPRILLRYAPPCQGVRELISTVFPALTT
jgi:hypothetical protein